MRPPEWLPVADLLLFDRRNPRSAAFQLAKLANQVRLLPEAGLAELLARDRRGAGRRAERRRPRGTRLLTRRRRSRRSCAECRDLALRACPTPSPCATSATSSEPVRTHRGDLMAASYRVEHETRYRYAARRVDLAARGLPAASRAPAAAGASPRARGRSRPGPSRAAARTTSATSVEQFTVLEPPHGAPGPGAEPGRGRCPRRHAISPRARPGRRCAGALVYAKGREVRRARPVRVSRRPTSRSTPSWPTSRASRSARAGRCWTRPST